MHLQFLAQRIYLFTEQHIFNCGDYLHEAAALNHKIKADPTTCWAMTE